ncbi:MAG: hypothetical protein IPK78_03310 [Rhodospirillales bacterium]|nr:hypothetical protein [Rhodospirillales bacterium]
MVDWIDKTGRRHNRQFRLYREADQFRRETERALEAGTFRPKADKVTVRDACTSFLEHCQGRQERGERMTRHCLAVYRGHINNHVLSKTYGIGATTLARLTAGIVGDFRDGMRSAGVSVPTARKVLSTLHGVLQFAIGKELIAVNPAHGVRVIGRRDEGSQKVRPPSKESVAALLMAAGENRLAIWFAAATGVRAGEQWALRWRHLDLAGGEVAVEARVDCYGRKTRRRRKPGCARSRSVGSSSAL